MEIIMYFLLYYTFLFILGVYLVGLIPAYFISKLYIRKFKTNENVVLGTLFSWVTIGIVLIIWIIQILIGLFLWDKNDSGKI